MPLVDDQLAYVVSDDAGAQQYSPWGPPNTPRPPVRPAVNVPRLGENGTWNVSSPTMATSQLNVEAQSTPVNQHPGAPPLAVPLARVDETSFAWQMMINTQAEMAALRQQMLQMQLNTSTPARTEYVEPPTIAVPSFDPDLSTGLTASQWVRRVEELKVAYGWSDSMCLARALGRLEGTARVWYNTAATDVLTWEHFKAAVTRAFPIYDDAASIHAQLAAKRKEPTETYAAYAYQMSSIAQRGRIDERDVVGYVLRGIDVATSTALAALQIDTIEQLLAAIARFQSRTSPTVPSATKTASSDAATTKKASPPAERRASPPCANCGSRDHISRNCRRGPRCYECQRFGHRAAECRQRKAAPRGRINLVNCTFRKRISIQGCEFEALLDTGADRNLVSKRTANKLSSPRRQVDLVLEGFGGAEIRCREQITVEAEIDDAMHRIEATIVPDHVIPTDVVLGSPWLALTAFKSEYGTVRILEREPKDAEKRADGLQEQLLRYEEQLIRYEEQLKQLRENRDKLIKCEIDLKNSELKARENEPELIRLKDDNDVPTETLRILLANVTDYENNGDLDLSHLPEEQRTGVKKLVREYTPTTINSARTTTKIVIIDPKPVALPPRRLAPAERAEVERQVQQWLDEGIIQPSRSEYSSPVVLVRKKDGSMRMCIDYRLLNKRVARDQFPMPQIDDQLDKLQRARVFSTIDLKNGFLHVPVEEDSRKFTAFATPSGLYEFLKTPFGYCGSPASFSRFIAEVFEPLVRKGTVAIYMDDVVILSADEHQAIEHLELVLEHAASYGLKINWTKCQFLQKRIRFLGHEIENGELYPDPQKIAAVAKFPQPKDVTQLRRFLGLSGYFRRFIANYSTIAKPLTRLLQKDTAYDFGSEQESAFTELKQRLCDHPVLTIYDPHAVETQLHTDASQQGIAAILLQRREKDDALRPVYYYAKTTTAPQQKYSSYELEMLAVVEALKRFRIYLLGLSFTIVTDCSAFQMTMSKRELSTRIARWALFLEDFDYKIIHRPGSAMQHADALSRACIMRIEDVMMHKIREAIHDDPEAQEILRKIKEGRNEGFLERNGLLYRLKNDRDLLYVPKRLQFDLLRRTHEAGHFAVKKTCEAFSREYWIPKLTDKVQRIIEHCVPCLLSMEKRGKQEGFLRPIDKSEGPLHTFHLDHLGPLADSEKGYKHLLVIIDAFSKFTWIFPVKSTTSRETVNKLRTIQTTFGNPHRVITDRGTAFTGHEFRSFCEEEKIQHVTVTTGVPRGNGQVERVHQVIKSVLTKMAVEQPDAWYKQTSKLQRMINSSYHRGIATTPCELMIGVPMRNKEDIELRRTIDRALQRAFCDERDELRLHARRQIFDLQTENRRSFNRKRKKARRYQPDELVAIRHTQFTTQGKFKTLFLGPYRILASRGIDRYRVEPRLTTTSADHLKPWSAPEELEIAADIEPQLATDVVSTLDNDETCVTDHHLDEGVEQTGSAELWRRHPYQPPVTRAKSGAAAHVRRSDTREQFP